VDPEVERFELPTDLIVIAICPDAECAGHYRAECPNFGLVVSGQPSVEVAQDSIRRALGELLDEFDKPENVHCASEQEIIDWTQEFERCHPKYTRSDLGEQEIVSEWGRYTGSIIEYIADLPSDIIYLLVSNVDDVGDVEIFQAECPNLGICLSQESVDGALEQALREIKVRLWRGINNVQLAYRSDDQKAGNQFLIFHAEHQEDDYQQYRMKLFLEKRGDVVLRVNLLVCIAGPRQEKDEQNELISVM